MSYKLINQPKNNQQGITLVELMVAMVIGLFLSAGVMQLFVSNKQTYRVTENMSRLQENGRFAMLFLTNDIRMAGYMGCRGQASILTNTLDDSGSSFLYGFNGAVEGFESTPISPVSTPMTVPTPITAWNPPIDSSINFPLGGSDIIAIRGISSSGIPITGQPSNSGDCTNSASHTANIKVSDAGSLTTGDIVIAGNCKNTSIFQITNTNLSSDTVVHNTGGSVSPGNSTTDLGACYAGDGDLYQMAIKIFYIRLNPSGIPSLYRTVNDVTEELVEGIENMKILYGEDTDADGAPNYYLPANLVDMSRVVAVRVSIVAVTLENNLTEQANPITVFGAPYTRPTYTPPTVDKRIRRVLTSTIVIRNRLP